MSTAKKPRLRTYEEMRADIMASPDLEPLGLCADLDESRMWLMMHAAEKVFGERQFCIRLAEWFRKNPQYNTDNVPYNVLAQAIRQALGWTEIEVTE